MSGGPLGVISHVRIRLFVNKGSNQCRDLNIKETPGVLLAFVLVLTARPARFIDYGRVTARWMHVYHPCL